MPFPFFWIIDLYLQIPVVIAEFFNPIAELIIPTGTPTNEANAEIKTQPLSRNKNKKVFFFFLVI